jgi:hypothetical protein
MVDIKPSVGSPNTSAAPSSNNTKTAAVSFQNQQNALAQSPKTNTVALATKPTSSSETSSAGKSSGGLNASSSHAPTEMATNKTITQKNQGDTGGENGKGDKNASGTISSKDSQTLATAVMESIAGSGEALRATSEQIKITLMKTGVTDKQANEILSKQIIRLREKLFICTKMKTSLKNELLAVRFNANPNVRRVMEIFPNATAA